MSLDLIKGILVVWIFISIIIFLPLSRLPKFDSNAKTLTRAFFEWLIFYVLTAVIVLGVFGLVRYLFKG